MSKRKTALFLSLIYCGLGQVYKGQRLKGFSLIIAYTLLIVSFIFRSSFASMVYFTVLCILILMWLMGMVDAYADDETFAEGRQSYIWQRLSNILEIVVIAGTFVAIIIVSYPGLDRTPFARKPGVRQVNKPAEFFSIQLAAFRRPEGAEEVYHKLLSRGYPVRIENPVPTGDNLYRILVGRFDDEQNAISFAEKLREQEGTPYIIIRRNR